MLNKVNGSLKGMKAERLRKLKNMLEPMGYEFSQDLSKFEKTATIESAVSELVPITEQLGFNVWEDLTLTELSEDSAYFAKYENGRVIRKFPRGV
ncbi:hypothetical protein MFMK1_000893 [Metallumcola ferriviriculae]|uniref:Uncharacterized protein n=1 Tax=Metallumcola ferriviriculae TaxID=3039180 RepID=A0AAU0UJY5_9FIRM|nr:hypothetical protein MFMK1_000893 [Desulfitibacteraceae bacterium MK1]